MSPTFWLSTAIYTDFIAEFDARFIVGGKIVTRVDIASAFCANLQSKTSVPGDLVMALLVLITGKQGSGKSWVAKEWASSDGARHIDVDRVLLAGGKEIPGSTGKDLTNWDLWRTAVPDIRERCVRTGLKTEYRELEGYDGDLVVEGAILCNIWFFEPMLAALKELIPGDGFMHCYYLNVSNATILRNVRARADEYPQQRGQEKLQFPTDEAVANAHRGFDEAVNQGPGRWIEFSSGQDLLTELQRLRG